MGFKYAHLSAGFMLTSIIGLLISGYFVTQISKTWGFTLLIFFGMMFISSILSMTHADFADEDDKAQLAIHKKPYNRHKKK